MRYIHYGDTLRALVAVQGHPFERDAFAALFEALPGISAIFVDQPAAGLLMTPAALRHFDVLVLYDMPGLDFHAPAAQRPAAVPPPPALQDGLRAVLQAGKGVLALHHAIAAWPTWDEYAGWLGGRFLYRRGAVRGIETPDSGYRQHVDYVARRVDALHPVLQGLPADIALRDELYLFEVFEREVTALLRADHRFHAADFHSAEAAVARGRMHDNEGWSHAPGSDLVGWVKRAENSPLVYLQPGDDAATFANPAYRQLVGNALRWLASPQALAWGARRPDRA